MPPSNKPEQPSDCPTCGAPKGKPPAGPCSDPYHVEQPKVGSEGKRDATGDAQRAHYESVVKPLEAEVERLRDKLDRIRWIAEHAEANGRKTVTWSVKSVQRMTADEEQS